MKVLSAYFLAFVVFAQSLLPRAATDLLHSPEVWAHFEEHRQESQQSLSFWEFLTMHYAADSDHTKQKKHHLPSFDLSGVAGFFVLPATTLELLLSHTYTFFETKSFLWDNSYSFLLTKSLIFPPRS